MCEIIQACGARAVIPSHPTRKTVIPLDRQTYHLRNRIERFFNRLKHFRRIATRFDRRIIYFISDINLVRITI